VTSCIYPVADVGRFENGRYVVTATNIYRSNTSSGSSSSGTTVLSAETGEARGQNYVDMGGGWAGAQATLYRDGLLVIASQAVSNANNSGTRGRVFVVGVDRRGRSLFVSQSFDIPTACGRWDTCSSDRSQNFQQRISSDIAKYVARLDVYPEDRGGGRSAREAFRVAITESCAAYDDLPVAARAAIAAETGFAGCNP
jgi:hypothetical protein